MISSYNYFIVSERSGRKPPAERSALYSLRVQICHSCHCCCLRCCLRCCLCSCCYCLAVAVEMLCSFAAVLYFDSTFDSTADAIVVTSTELSRVFITSCRNQNVENCCVDAGWLFGRSSYWLWFFFSCFNYSTVRRYGDYSPSKY